MRWLNKIYAKIFGHFWVECRLCRKMFGGHECANTVLMQSCIVGYKVCNHCDERADKINSKTGLGIKYDKRWQVKNTTKV